jgi:hypothetical protein
MGVDFYFNPPHDPGRVSKPWTRRVGPAPKSDGVFHTAFVAEKAWQDHAKQCGCDKLTPTRCFHGEDLKAEADKARKAAEEKL